MNRAELFRHPGRLTAAVCLFFLVLATGGCGRKETAGAGPYAAFGEILARNTVAPGGGTNLVIVTGPAENTGSVIAQLTAAYQDSLAKLGRTATVERVEVPEVLRPGINPLPAAQFQELLQKYASADCLVSFVGVPVLTPDQMAQLPSPRPKVVAAVVFNPPSRAMFDGKVLWQAVLHKTGVDPAVTPGPSAQEQFDALYQLVTPENADTVLP